MRSEELWLVQENHATVKPDSSATPGGMKTYTAKAESNCEIYREILAKSSQFLTSEQPCELKSLGVEVALNFAGVGKIRSENLRLCSTLEVIQSSSSFEWKDG